MDTLPPAQMTVYRTHNGPCPYLPDGQWVTDVMYAAHIAGPSYETLLENGWRRSGCCFYRTCCPDCEKCIPIRIDVGRFRPDRAQTRVLKRNQSVSIERIPAAFHARDYALYKTYCIFRHGQDPSEEDYRHFLVASPLRTEIIRYHDGPSLIATAWIDVLPNAVSSVYCAYDPDSAPRSPGTLSILRQVALCRELDKSWLYLGFYVPESPRMSYKRNFRPHQMFIGRQWREA